MQIEVAIQCNKCGHKIKNWCWFPISRLGTLKLSATAPALLYLLHPLSGEFAGHYSIVVNGNWRITFKFEGEDVVLVDYLDYH
ncbi:MAG: type II toxin-antitoxin system RelE/ParE family toxin [Methylobacter sp.]